MLQKFLTTGALLIAFLSCALTAGAQDSGEAPKPAMAGDSASAVLRPDVPQDVPDTRPLAGAQNLSLGIQSATHSFLLPSFGVTTQVQFNRNSFSQANGSSPISASYVSGRLAINKISPGSELLVDYLAGGGFSSDSGLNSSIIQSLDFAETLHGGRWTLMLGDQFTYLPASSFNFGGLGGLNNLGVNLGTVGSAPRLRQDLIPNQSIITNGAARIGNGVVAQTTYALGYRSSVTFLGGYGLLDFVNGGLQNSSNVSARGGYNYLLSPLNSMSVSYGFNRLMLANSLQGTDDHSVQLSFARRVTGRLSFQIGAGPDIQLDRVPLAGTGTVVSWALNSGLTYQLRNVGTGFSYMHALTGGSGVLPGAETDMFSGSLGRKFGHWEVSVSAGYSRNSALQQTILNASGITPQGWFGGAQASRHFVGYGSLFFSYNVSRQSGLTGICPLAACATNTVTQTISIGYNWGFRPIVLE